MVGQVPHNMYGRSLRRKRNFGTGADWAAGLRSSHHLDDSDDFPHVDGVRAPEMIRVGSEARGGVLRASTPVVPVISLRDGKRGGCLLARDSGD
jgi:hypothetical protein